MKQRLNKQDEKAKTELKSRLNKSYGVKIDKEPSDKNRPSPGLSQVQRRQKRNSGDPTSTFLNEQIEPCDCGLRFHRVCIRDKIVQNLLKKCPECSIGYSVGFSDCYAIRNKIRPNYLAYMLVQEILFFLSIIAFSEVTRQTTMQLRSNKNANMNTLWYIILQTLTTACTGLAIFSFLIRLKGIYCVREIEDIIVFDKSQRQTLDFDSPAILTVFFQDILKYESQ